MWIFDPTGEPTWSGTRPEPEYAASPCYDGSAAMRHEWEYSEDTIGDDSIPNGTYIERLLTCCVCGDCKGADWRDAPSFDDWDHP